MYVKAWLISIICVFKQIVNAFLFGLDKQGKKCLIKHFVTVLTMEWHGSHFYIVPFFNIPWQLMQPRWSAAWTFIY